MINGLIHCAEALISSTCAEWVKPHSPLTIMQADKKEPTMISQQTHDLLESLIHPILDGLKKSGVDDSTLSTVQESLPGVLVEAAEKFYSKK